MSLAAPRCVATDLDRTLTGADLALDARALARVDALREAGILVVIATGRRIEELVAMGLDRRSDALVAENGAVVALPRLRFLETTDPRFRARAKRALGELAGAFRWGRVLGSGPRELAAAAESRLEGLPHALEYNAEEVMILPAGVDKGSGLSRALRRLRVRPDEAWAIGDGENDVAMLRLARVSAAPANAVAAAQEAATVQLVSSYGQAFLDLTEPLVARSARAR